MTSGAEKDPAIQAVITGPPASIFHKRFIQYKSAVILKACMYFITLDTIHEIVRRAAISLCQQIPW